MLKSVRESKKSSVFKNNLFVIKLCFNECTGAMIYYLFMTVFSEVAIFFEWVVGIKFVLECVEFNKPILYPIIFLIAMLIVHALNAALSGYCWHNVWLKAQPKLSKALKSILYDKASVIDLECYDNPKYYNDYVLVINEANNIISRVTQLLQMFVLSIVIMVFYGGYYFFEDATSFVFVIVSFTMTYISNRLLNKVNFDLKISVNPLEHKREYINRTHYLSDYAKELRIYPEYGRKIRKDFETVNKDLETIYKAYSVKKFVLSFFKTYMANNFVMDIMFLIFILYQAAVAKTITYSSVIVLFTSAARLKSSLETVAQILPYAQETSLYIDKIKTFLGYKSKIVSKNQTIPVSNQTIEFKNVGFEYDDDGKKILHDICLNIDSGDRIAIVGCNGAGKTTLIKVLLRLYDVTNGEVLFNGINIKEYDLSEYRKQYSTAFQDFKIFACTLKENVTLDTLEVDDSIIQKLLVKAGLESKLKLLDYNLDIQLTTEFDDNGVSLSGGEAQKVAIARTFYNDSPIIVLDEPSAALDPISEHRLNNIISQNELSKTIIFVSHRLSTTKNADKIIVLKDGKIIECGTHKELLESNGTYAEMWYLQSKQYLE